MAHSFAVAPYRRPFLEAPYATHLFDTKAFACTKIKESGG